MLLKEMRELVEELNIYAHAYYMEDTSLISDYEYDKKYDRLKELEKVTGIILANSPTINVGSETVSELEKVEHDHPMLSLDKTKDINEVESFMNGLPGLAMLKMDGLTISVKYIDGKLVAAETRGNGIIGENVLHTANSFVNLPKEIPYKDEVVVDGEAVMEIHHYTYLKELKDIDLKKDGERKGLFGEELEKYIKDTYSQYHPKTTFIAYGADVSRSELASDDKIVVDWFKEKQVKPKNYYLVVGRFVPENSFEIMIREFMKSKSKKDFALITNVNDKFLNELENKLHFRRDPRIKFVGTVYDQELLKKIRENAYAYFHGHTVGGTNPSLIEALGSTDLNLLVDIGFNREVAEDCALYWSKELGELAKLINQVEVLKKCQIDEIGTKAKARVLSKYTWDEICSKYMKVFFH